MEPSVTSEREPHQPTSETADRDLRFVHMDTTRLPSSMAALASTFTRWFGPEYDLDAIYATLAAAAAVKLGGDPPWLLLVSGPGNAKTETVSALEGAGAHVVSTIASEGALLSATSKGERTNEATGGLLRTIGDVGVLVLKDFTSILSLSQSVRPGVLAALREIYDGRWTRTVGVDGGRTLEWTGRIGVIGAVTTEWDRKHDSVSSMGDRFVLLRLDSTVGRLSSGRQAIANTGYENQMRAELAAAAKAALDQSSPVGEGLRDYESERLLLAANLVTLGRTAVVTDIRGEVIDSHLPEVPTRFAKQLTQIARGGMAIGLDRERAIMLAIRCARDSMPPIRLAVLRDLTRNGTSSVSDVRHRLDKPHNTIDRALKSLHMLEMVTLREERGRMSYSLASDIDPTVLFPEKELPPQPHIEGMQGCTSFPGNRDSGRGALQSEVELIQKGRLVAQGGKHNPKP